VFLCSCKRILAKLPSFAGISGVYRGRTSLPVYMPVLSGVPGLLAPVESKQDDLHRVRKLGTILNITQCLRLRQTLNWKIRALAQTSWKKKYRVMQSWDQMLSHMQCCVVITEHFPCLRMPQECKKGVSIGSHANRRLTMFNKDSIVTCQCSCLRYTGVNFMTSTSMLTTAQILFQVRLCKQGA